MTDAPRSVLPMVKVLRELGEYKYDSADVFRDFIDFTAAGFCIDGDPELAGRLKKKYGKDYQQLGNLQLAWMQVMDQHVSDAPGGWFDALGELYEYLASQSKKSWLGQFFTPQTLCDLMVRITADSEMATAGKRVNDSCCGSGRMLLAFNQAYPGNYVYGEDLDPICAKMTALNMAIHGCQGQVCCMNSITLKDWRFGYQVNYYHRFGAPPVPHLFPIREEQSVTMQQWSGRLDAVRAEKAAQLQVPPPAKALTAGPPPPFEKREDMQTHELPSKEQLRQSQLTLF